MSFGTILNGFGEHWGSILGGLGDHFVRFWVLLQALCRHLGRPPGRQTFIRKPSPLPTYIAPCGMWRLPLRIRAVPWGHASACEGTCTYLNFCTSLPALTFLHFPFCTYSCTSLPALPFLHLLSCTLSWSGVPPGVKFPPEGGGLAEIFLMGDLFLEWGPAKS